MREHEEGNIKYEDGAVEEGQSADIGNSDEKDDIGEELENSGVKGKTWKI